MRPLSDYRAYFTPALADRLLSKVDASAWASCWTWTGTTNRGGYGKICIGPRRAPELPQKMAFVHRVTYALAYGRFLDPDVQLDHLCMNTSCVNPSHLEPVTNAENQRRRAEARRQGLR